MTEGKQGILIVGTLIYVGPDTEKNLHLYVKKHRWPSILKIIEDLKRFEGKEVQVIVKEWGNTP